MEDFIGLVSSILTDLARARVTYNNFHNLIFLLTRDAFGVFLIQHSLENFLFPEGWLEKGLQGSPYLNLVISAEIAELYLCLTRQHISRAAQKTNSIASLAPIHKRLQAVFLHI